MRQFTMNIDDGLLLAAKKHALENGRNVSDIVRDLLAREVGWSTTPKTASMNDDAKRSVLERFSDGKVTRRSAMDEIGLAPFQYAEFVELMRHYSLAWPEIDRQQIDREAEIVVEAIRDAHGED